MNHPIHFPYSSTMTSTQLEDAPFLNDEDFAKYLSSLAREVSQERHQLDQAIDRISRILASNTSRVSLAC